MIPEDFLNTIASLPGIDATAFASAMSEPASVSVKINRRKCADVAELGYVGPEPVKWCGSGYYLPERPVFTLNPLLHAGVFYVQDASSMIHETLVSRIVSRGGLPANPVIADLCAAPGGKTTSMINALPDGSLVIANEVDGKRVIALGENLVKWGYPDFMVTNSPVSRFAALGEVFDLIAVDAPCSGEGMMRKDETAVSQWSPGLVSRCAALQREILTEAVKTLKPGGWLIYSTCTFNQEENEGNVEWLVSEYGLEPMDMELPAEWGIGRSVVAGLPAMRFMPHLTRGEGLFAAVLRKPGKSDSGNHAKIREAIRKKLKVTTDGIPTIVMKGKLELPAGESVLSTDFSVDKYPATDVDLETALAYLRHEAITLPPETERGYVVVRYNGHPLGLVKNIGTRANNLYPASWRIRMNTK